MRIVLSVLILQLPAHMRTCSCIFSFCGTFVGNAAMMTWSLGFKGTWDSLLKGLKECLKEVHLDLWPALSQAVWKATRSFTETTVFGKGGLYRLCPHILLHGLRTNPCIPLQKPDSRSISPEKSSIQSKKWSLLK